MKSRAEWGVLTFCSFAIWRWTVFIKRFESILFYIFFQNKNRSYSVLSIALCIVDIAFRILFSDHAAVDVIRSLTKHFSQHCNSIFHGANAKSAHNNCKILTTNVGPLPSPCGVLLHQLGAVPARCRQVRARGLPARPLHPPCLRLRQHQRRHLHHNLHRVERCR